ncbi:MAG: hypothetical protein Q8R35_01800 [bacterium]|nr:hypothetical protein [bacterium]
MANHAPEDGPPRPVCVHDKCTAGDGHHDTCVPIDPESKGRLDRAIPLIIAVIIGVVVLAVAGIIALSYGILRGG